MRAIIFFSAFVVLAVVIGHTLPWGMLTVLAALFGMRYGKSIGHSFLLFFLAGMVAWVCYALYIDLQNESILSQRIGEMLGGVHHYVIILITGVIGGLVAGTGAMSGAAFSIWQRKKK